MVDSMDLNAVRIRTNFGFLDWCNVPAVLVKRTLGHCKTAEFLMKACWKKGAQVVAGEPQKETVIYEKLKVN